MNTIEEGDDPLTASVQRGLYKLRQGDFFMSYGLDESTLKVLLPLPDLSDKDAPLHAFLRAVATEEEEGNEEDNNSGQAKPKRKMIKGRFGELMRRRDDWVPLIASFPGVDDPTSTGEGVKKKRKSARQVQPAETDDQAPTGAQQPSAQKSSKSKRIKRPLSETDDAAASKDNGEGTEAVEVDEQLDQNSLEKVPKKRRMSKQAKRPEKAKKLQQQPKKKAKSSKAKKSSGIVTKELLEKRRAEVKREFEARQTDIMEQLPAEVKGRFRQMGFCKWSKNVLPILILSPYDVPPGPVRQQWMKMFENCKKQGRLQDMTNLIYWYGASNTKECYSFETTKNIITYEAGCKKGYQVVPPRIQKQLDNEAVLKKGDAEIYNGLCDMAEDANKDPIERRRGIVGFPEEYDLITEQDISELDENDDDEEDDTMDDDEEDDEEEKVIPDTKLDPEPVTESTKVVDLEKVALPQPTPKQANTAVANEVDDFGEAEMSDADGVEDPHSADDDDDFKPPEVVKKVAAPASKKKRKQPPNPRKETEEKQGDSKSDAEVPPKKKRPKKQAPAEAEPKTKKEPRKSEPKKVEKKSIPTEQKKVEKKPSSTKRSKEEEQELFTECQDQYLPLVHKWQLAIDEANVASLTEVLDELTPLVDKFSASFFEAYRLNEMMKPKTRELVKENDAAATLYHLLWNKMKTVYKEKKATMPDDFVAVKRPHVKSAAAAKEIKQEEKGESIASKRPRPDDRESAVVKQENLEAKGADTANVPEVSLSQSSVVPRKRSNEDESSRQARLEAFSNQSAPSSQQSQGTEAKSPTRPASQGQVALPKPEKKKFSLGNWMRPKEPASTNIPDRRSSGDEPKSACNASDKGNAKKMPDWMTKPPGKNPPTSSVRSFGHEFLIQAAGTLPEDVVNIDGVAVELEEAIYQYSVQKTKASDDKEQEGGTDDKNAPWYKFYWKMVYLLVAAITGKYEKSSLHPLLLNGKYSAAMDVVRIPESNLRRAFENQPLLDHVRD